MQLAHNTALQGLQLAEDINYPEGIRRARHTLGRIAYASGKLVEAETNFQNALESVRGGQPSPNQSKLYFDFAAFAHAQAKPDTAILYLCKAFTASQRLQMPKYVERAEQLAQKYGMTLTEIELEDLETEDSSDIPAADRSHDDSF